ncbi:nuclear transport factor 2 family protein [Caballeronia sp. Lep1P3]|uniref:nuclear transport factor 2 family protein n=1 Tax=Caballeronia sp. Lep1P3 TaxID=2878150 RepID=UPI001FD18593|nr:nuclear transport factor 2 family protein [Caballeronia sp. Lep1P3]
MNKDDVLQLFSKLKDDTDAFFARVADDVDWTVMGTHPLAGRYRSKQAFLDHTFARLAKALPEGAQLTVTGALVDGDTAAVELRSDVRAANGMHFDNRYCWVCRFANGYIVEVRAYLDSAMVAELLRENPA